MDNTEASPRHARSTAFRARHLAITTLAGLALAAAAAGPAHAAPVPVAGYAAPASVAALQPPAGTSLAAALTAAVPAALPAATTTTYATTANVNLRVGASTKHRVVVVLTKGTKVVLRSSSGSWHKITANGKTGWVSKTYVKRTAVTSASASATTTTAKNVRLATTANLFLRSSAPSGSVLATMK
ncbi:SH3 domain-containing protein, partial [Arthrobacter halodurans]